MQPMEVPGQDDIDHTELDSRAASQVCLAALSMDKVYDPSAKKCRLANLSGQPPYKKLK